MLWHAESKIGLLKAHKWGILAGVLAAFLVALPTYLSVYRLGSAYRGVPFMYQDYESTYLARIHDILDGHPGLGSPVVYEYKDTPTPLTPTGEWIYALPSLVLRVPLVFTVSMSKFVFPLILFFLVYIFAYRLIKDFGGSEPRLYATTAGVGVALGYDLVHMGEALRSILYGSTTVELSVWTRLVNPITGAILLFVFLIALWRTLEGSRFAWILGGVMLGVMLGYIFSFALGAIISGLTFVYLLSRKEYILLKKVSGTIGLGIVLGFFSASRYLFGTGNHDAGTPLRNGLLLTHLPLINKLLVLTALVWGLVWWYRAKGRRASVFVWMILLTAFIAMNQQIVTGRTIWPAHFVQYTIPLCIIILTLCLSLLGQRYRRLMSTIALVVIGISFLWGLSTLGSISRVMPQFAETQRYGGALTWLVSHAPKDCSVLVREEGEDLAQIIPALTPCNTYYTTYVFVGLPDERITQAYFAHLRLNGIGVGQIHSYLEDHSVEIQANFFRDWKEIFRHSTDPWLVAISDRKAINAYFDTLNKNLASEYKSFLQKDFYSELTQYRLDYIISDEAKYPTPDLSRFLFLKPVYTENKIHVYAVVH